MKCQFLRYDFGFPECHSIFKEPIYPLEFRYDGYCIKGNHINCPFYQAGEASIKGDISIRKEGFQIAA